MAMGVDEARSCHGNLLFAVRCWTFWHVAVIYLAEQHAAHANAHTIADVSPKGSRRLHTAYMSSNVFGDIIDPHMW